MAFPQESAQLVAQEADLRDRDEVEANLRRELAVQVARGEDLARQVHEQVDRGKDLERQLREQLARGDELVGQIRKLQAALKVRERVEAQLRQLARARGVELVTGPSPEEEK